VVVVAEDNDHPDEVGRRNDDGEVDEADSHAVHDYVCLDRNIHPFDDHAVRDHGGEKSVLMEHLAGCIYCDCRVLLGQNEVHDQHYAH
jgi:hypothetical protein